MSDIPDDLAAEDRALATRRGLLLGGAALAAAGVAVGAKLSAQAGSATASDELIVAFDGTTISKFVLDPHNSVFAPHGRVMRSIYDNLVQLLPDGSVGPWLAQSWTLSPDRLAYDFTLRRGVSFHDGTPFDAAAVKANFDRIADKRNVLMSRRSIGPFAGAEVLADDRVRVRLKKPFTPLLRNLAMTRLAMVSPTAVAKYGKVFSQHPVGTGPFRFVSMRTGEEIRLARNPHYAWAPPTASHDGPARVRKLTFRNVPEEWTRVAVLLSGQAHVADFIPPQNVAEVRGNPKFRLLQKELLNTNYAMMLNVTRPPWDDEEMRLAFRLALDIDTIVRIVYLGLLPRAWSPLSPSLYGSAERTLAGTWRPDPARADAILTRKGWVRGEDGIRVKDGRPLSVVFIDTQGNREKRLDVMQLVRRQLAEAGIDLRIDSTPGGGYADRIKSNRYDLIAAAQFQSDPDVLRTYFVSEERTAVSGTRVNDPQLTALLQAATEAPEGPERADLYVQAQRRIIDKTYNIPVYVLLYNLAAAANVSGLAIDAHGFPDFHGAALNA